MYFVVCFQKVFPKLRGLMASKSMAPIKKGLVLKVVLVVGVLTFVFCKELVDDGFTLSWIVIRSGWQV